MAGDDIDPFEIKGNLSVITTDNPECLGDGSIDVDGHVNTDFLACNKIENGIIINDITNYHMREITHPEISPNTGEHLFFIDNNDFKLKSKSSSEEITVYQPTTTKGDIIVHNGDTQVRLPVPLRENFILISDKQSPEGIKWSSQIADNNSVTVSLAGDMNFTEIKDIFNGTFIVSVYNKITGGASGLFIITKNSIDSPVQFSRLSGNSGFYNDSQLQINWGNFQELELGKQGNNQEENGEYICDFIYSKLDTKNITISTNLWYILPETLEVGNYILFISNGETMGPTAVFFLSKTDPLSNTSAYFKIISSPSIDNGVINVRWLSNTGIEMQKTTLLYDGIYSFIDLLSLEKVYLIEIFLTGVQNVEIYKKYQRFTGIVSVDGSNSKAIFSISKNKKTRQASILTLAKSGENILSLTWSQNDSIKLSKTSESFDGVYIVKIIGKK
jgi:hypothetical protein